MKKNSIVLFVLLILTQACLNTNFPGYKEIVFFDSVEQVADSIVMIEGLLIKLPNSDVVNCYINNEDEFIINNSSIGLMSNLKSDMSLVLNNSFLIEMSNNEKLRFFNLLSFLQKNDITGAYYNKRWNLFMFLYKDQEFKYIEHDFRNIVLKSNMNKKSLDSFKVLDEKEGLILLAPKGAKIN